MTDQDHIYFTAIRSGERAGLKQIYIDFLPRITSLVTRNGGTKDDAYDVFQDALVILFEKCRNDSFTLSSSFYTLLYGICRNLWGNRLQKKARTEVTLEEDYKYNSTEDFSDLIQEEEKRSIFWNAFRKLGEDCQRLMTLFFEKTSMDEIARIMNFGSEGYAKKRKFQCKEHLLQLVKSDSSFIDFQSE